MSTILLLTQQIFFLRVYIFYEWICIVKFEHFSSFHWKMDTIDKYSYNSIYIQNLWPVISYSFFYKSNCYLKLGGWEILEFGFKIFSFLLKENDYF